MGDPRGERFARTPGQGAMRSIARPGWGFAKLRCPDRMSGLLRLKLLCLIHMISMLVDLESTLQMNYINIFAPVAQLDRVSVSEAEGRRFDSCQAHH